MSADPLPALRLRRLRASAGLRAMLTETTVRASDRRAVFVGVETYEAAGGIVLRDLFESDDGGWLQDAALLDRLVAEKLKATADESLRLSDLTLPHAMVRVLLIEQLYRAWSVNANHPYHRE